jgi:TPR repeat protein
MKRVIKVGFIFLLVLISGIAEAQVWNSDTVQAAIRFRKIKGINEQPSPHQRIPVVKSAEFIKNLSLLARDTDVYRLRLLMNKSSRLYNPEKAYTESLNLAGKGNTNAMNILGILYCRGIGTNINDREGYKWIAKAAQLNEPSSFYNLGLLYKYGIGTELNLEKAFVAFSKGVKANEANSFYGKAYMLFKGFGCNQDYEQAVLLLKKGVVLRNKNAMYLLGICYRNGYGVAKNIDSANLWLRRTANYGDGRAIEELASVLSENAEGGINNQSVKKANNTIEVGGKSGHFKETIKINKSNLAGTYAGQSLRFDWSGQHVISNTKLTLILKEKNNELQGDWLEENQIPLSFTGAENDTSIVFNDLPMLQKSDHYYPKKQLSVEFKHSILRLTKANDTTYLTGKVVLYSPQSKEPEKSMYVLLYKSDSQDQATGHLWVNSLSAIDSLNFRPFPNPFVDRISLHYTLSNSCYVSILVSDITSGKTIYRSASLFEEKGDYTKPLDIVAPSGTYVITLRYGKQLKSAIILKK